MHMGLTFHHRFRLSHKNCYNANSNCEGKYTRSVVIINALVWIRFSVLLLSLKKPWENKGIEWSKLEMMEGRGPAYKLLFIVLPQVGAWEAGLARLLGAGPRVTVCVATPLGGSFAAITGRGGGGPLCQFIKICHSKWFFTSPSFISM